MGRLVACKGENMKKKLLIILPACILGIVLIIFGVLYYKAAVPVREVEAEKLQKIHFKEEVNSAYACGYNSYGRIIFKHPKAALKQFKQDYAEGLAYMAKVYDLPEFSEQYEVLVQYEIYGWQTLYRLYVKQYKNMPIDTVKKKRKDSGVKGIRLEILAKVQKIHKKWSAGYVC